MSLPPDEGFDAPTPSKDDGPAGAGEPSAIEERNRADETTPADDEPAAEKPADDEPAEAAAYAANAGSRRPTRRERRRARLARRSKLRRRLTRTGIAVCLLALAIVGSVVGYLEYQVHQIGHIAVSGLHHVSGPTENILLVGSTDRCAVKPAKGFENFVEQCAQGVNGINSDVVMILHLAPGKPASLLSIPRDTFVPDARVDAQANKIDAALVDGPSQLVAAIQDDFGIPINHYVVLNFETFANIVTALGGIKLYFPTTLFDSYSGLRINNTGCVHISGLMALALVRARHMNYDYDKKTGQWLGYDPTGDLGRIERVHLFLKALASEVAKRGIGNPFTDNSLLSALAPDLTVDSTFGTSEMLHLVLDYHSSLSHAVDLTLPIVEDANSYYDYMGGNYGAVVFPVEPQDTQTIDTFLGGAPKLPAPSSIKVAVVDGTGSSSETSAVASALGGDGFHVLGTSSTTPVGPISEAEVLYRGAANQAAAEQVLRAMRGTAVLAIGIPPAGAQVAVVTGSNSSVAHVSLAASASSTKTAKKTATHSTAATASPATTTPSSASASTTATSTSTGAGTAVPNAGGILSSPTSQSEAIPWYDPRSCPGT